MTSLLFAVLIGIQTDTIPSNPLVTPGDPKPKVTVHHLDEVQVYTICKTSFKMPEGGWKNFKQPNAPKPIEEQKPKVTFRSLWRRWFHPNCLP